MPSVLKPRRWLAKATFTSPDLSGGTNGGLLSPDQFKEFIRVATDEAVILKEARQEFSNATKFEVPRLSFHGVRILTNGVEATRLADADRKKPVTGMVTLSTNLFRGEVPVSDEIFEDSVEQAGIGDTIMEGLGRAVGRDIEDFAIKSDTARIAGDNEGWLDSFDGLIKTAQTELGATQEITMTGISDPETVMRKMLEGMPYRYRGDPSQMRLFVPVKLSDAWTDQLSARGTPLGDETLVGGKLRAFRGIPVVPTPLLSGTGTINSVAQDYTKFAILTNPKNIIVGWHRRLRVERFRDPREGATSFCVSLRYDVKYALPEAVVLGFAIDAI